MCLNVTTVSDLSVPFPQLSSVDTWRADDRGRGCRPGRSLRWLWGSGRTVVRDGLHGILPSCPHERRIALLKRQPGRWIL